MATLKKFLALLVEGFTALGQAESGISPTVRGNDASKYVS